jgi:hypothetical protein
MNIQPDFEELLRLLEKHGVDYMVVGGYAVAFHGYPRFTKDIDIFFKASTGNVICVRNALLEFGFKDGDIPEDIFLQQGNVLTFGVVPVRVDFVNEIDGVSYAKAKKNRVRGKYGKIEVNFIGRNELIQNKQATPRARDKADVEELS